MPPKKNEASTPRTGPQELEEARQEEQDFVDSISIDEKNQNAPEATYQVQGQTASEKQVVQNQESAPKS